MHMYAPRKSAQSSCVSNMTSHKEKARLKECLRIALGVMHEQCDPDFMPGINTDKSPLIFEPERYIQSLPV